MHEKKISQAEIACALRRDRSTICRELRRNFWHDRDVPIASGYWHVTAHGMAADRRRKYRKLLRDPGLYAAVIDRLKDRWSPEQISGRLRLAGGVATRLSHETIYQYVCCQEGQDQQLGRHLPERRRRRRPRYARKPRSLVFPMECAIRNIRSRFGVRIMARAQAQHGNNCLVLRSPGSMAEGHGRGHKQACSTIPSAGNDRAKCQQSGDPFLV